jgi:hypothetical protein
MGETVFTRERHAIIAVRVDGGNIPGEDRSLSGKREGVGKGVGMAQLPAVRERAIGSSSGLIRIAAKSAQDNMTKALTPISCP